MRNKYSSNDSLFSVDYKIPFERSRIEEHLQSSQEELNFIKVKLTEAYEKLEEEIKSSTELEEQNEALARRARESEEKYLYQKKENIKLKETLELILKNRKIMQEEIDQARENTTRKVADRDRLIDDLQKELKALSSKHTALLADLEEKTQLVREYSGRLREESEQEDHREAFLASKIEILEQEIARITEEKYVEVSRLRHELQLYQRSATPAKETPAEGRREERKREFSRAAVPRKQPGPKFDTRVSEESECSQFNKENVHSLQLNMPSLQLNMPSFSESSVSKWKRAGSAKEPKEEANQSAPIAMASEDQQLTQYQLARKKAEQELCALEKIKRPSNEQREKQARLEREIYHLDSDIAGLKRKIRRKY